MKDFLGQELAVGDIVVFPKRDYRELVYGFVIKLTPKKVKAFYDGRWSQTETYTGDPHMFVKVSVSPDVFSKKVREKFNEVWNEISNRGEDG